MNNARALGASLAIVFAGACSVGTVGSGAEAGAGTTGAAGAAAGATGTGGATGRAGATGAGGGGSGGTTGLAGTTGAPSALNVNGTAGNDTIALGGKQVGTIWGGAGGDLIAIGFANQPVTIAYKAAADSLLDLTGSSGIGGTGAMDRVTGFATGLDKIRLVDLGPAFNSAQIIVDRGEVTAPGDVLPLLSNPTFFMDVTNTLRKVVQFDYFGGTMLVADANANGVYDSGDLVIYLVGVTNVANSDLVGS